MILSVVEVVLIIHFKQNIFFSKPKPVGTEPTVFPQPGGCHQLVPLSLPPFDSDSLLLTVKTACFHTKKSLQSLLEIDFLFLY